MCSSAHRARKHAGSPPPHLARVGVQRQVRDRAGVQRQPGQQRRALKVAAAGQLDLAGRGAGRLRRDQPQPAQPPVRVPADGDAAAAAQVGRLSVATRRDLSLGRAAEAARSRHTQAARAAPGEGIWGLTTAEASKWSSDGCGAAHRQALLGAGGAAAAPRRTTSAVVAPGVTHAASVSRPACSTAPPAACRTCRSTTVSWCCCARRQSATAQRSFECAGLY